MIIEQKLALSNNWNSIYFFTEGIFAQLYGVSLYLAVVKLGLSVKVCGYRYKKLNNQLILRAGLPTKTLEKHYGTVLIKRDFGCELQSDIVQDENSYYKWYEAQLAYALAQEQLSISIKNTSKNTSATNLSVSEDQVTAEPIGTRFLLLSEQEYEFLKNWQIDRYPSSIESGFIRGLHQKIACSSA